MTLTVSRNSSINKGLQTKSPVIYLKDKNFAQRGHGRTSAFRPIWGNNEETMRKAELLRTAVALSFLPISVHLFPFTLFKTLSFFFLFLFYALHRQLFLFNVFWTVFFSIDFHQFVCLLTYFVVRIFLKLFFRIYFVNQRNTKKHLRPRLLLHNLLAF